MEEAERAQASNSTNSLFAQVYYHIVQSPDLNDAQIAQVRSTQSQLSRAHSHLPLSLQRTLKQMAPLNMLLLRSMARFP